jgi:hypothetical protein
VEGGEDGDVSEGPHDLNALAAHLEGRPEGDERRRTIEHLSVCLECRETAAMLSRSWTSLRAQDRSPAARLWWLGVAAAAVLGTAVAVQLLPIAPPVASPSAPAVSASPSPPLAVPSPRDTPRASPSARGAGSVIDESLLATRGGSKRVAGKTFRLVRGEWVDSGFDPAAGLPVVEVIGPEERRQILVRLPGLAPYLALGDRVVVVFEGTVYRSRANGSV